MNIKGMVQREDFYKINENTLKRYFYKVHGKDVQVKTKKWNIFNQVFIYPKLGMEMVRMPSKKAFQYMLNEYNVRNNTVKFLLAKAYVVICFFSFGLLAAKGLDVDDKTVFDKSMLVIPANRKIRIFNFATGYVDAIVKDTFTKTYFNNELAFRQDCVYDFVPSIQEHGEDWYREEILGGQALARVTDEALYKKGMADAVCYIGIMAKDTLAYEDSQSYVNNLYRDIFKKMDIANATKSINCHDIIIEIADKALASALILDAPIPTVESHGDLQAGNVWVDTEKEKTYIIDWETHERRSIWYDCATILLSIRRAGKLKEMMNNREDESVKDAVFMNDSKKEYNMLAVMGIITLEDILFYLDDMLELPGDFGGDIFNRIAGELDAMGWREKND